MSNWWANKIGGGTATAPAPQQQYVPQQQVPQAPPGYQLVPIQQAPPQAPPGYQLVPVGPQQHAPANVKMDYKQFMAQHDGEKISKYWQGGVALRSEGHLHCPQCGSGEGYTEYTGTASGAAPHCLLCGYSTRIPSQGMPGNWG